MNLKGRTRRGKFCKGGFKIQSVYAVLFTLTGEPFFTQMVHFCTLLVSPLFTIVGNQCPRLEHRHGLLNGFRDFILSGTFSDFFARQSIVL